MLCQTSAALFGCSDFIDKLIHHSCFAPSEMNEKSWKDFLLRVLTEVFIYGEKERLVLEPHYKLCWHETEASSGRLCSLSKALLRLHLLPWWRVKELQEAPTVTSNTLKQHATWLEFHFTSILFDDSLYNVVRKLWKKAAEVVKFLQMILYRSEVSLILSPEL